MLREDIFISETESVKEAFKKLDRSAQKVLLVVDGQHKLLGTITDGDIRRYILKGKGLESDISTVYNRSPKYLKKEDFSTDRAKKILIDDEIELLPIVNERSVVVDYITWAEAFSGRKKDRVRSSINIPVVIMAGGKGSRLEPFSKIFPKSLIPIGEKPIIELVIDEFRKYGANHYYVMVNYKGEMIKSYFDSIRKDYQIEFVSEKTFLGTAGGLKLLEEKISDAFIVSNCDVIVRADYGEVINFHRKKKASLTVLSSVQYHKIPYGVTEFKEGGEVTVIHEKPEYTFTVNTGVYVLRKKCLQLIPEESRYDMTDLIKSLIENGEKVITYPVNENDYIDIGQWGEYKKAIARLQL